MGRLRILVILLIACFVVVIPPTTASARDTGPPTFNWSMGVASVYTIAATNDAPLWRFHSRKNGDLFLYTADPVERANIIANLSATWVSQGTVGLVSTSAVGTTPIYRFHNLKNGGFVYTDESEKAAFQGQPGTWALDGVTLHVAPGGTVPCHRFHNTVADTYFYTGSENERAAILATNPGIYHDDGVAWYMNPTGVPDPPVTYPVAVDDVATAVGSPATSMTVAAPGVLSNDVLSGGDHAVLESGPAHGNLVLDASGGYEYKPIDGFSGLDAFHYRLFNGIVSSQPATVSITVGVQPVTYTISVTSGAHGTISPSGNQTVTAGSDKTFTVAADTGYSIEGVVKDGTSIGASSSVTFANVTANHTISAAFAINTYTLTYTAGANGSISGISPQTVNYNGSGTAVTAVPDTGYHFASWSDGFPNATRTDVEVTADTSVTATFEAGTVQPTLKPVYRFVHRKKGFYMWSADPTERNIINSTLGATWKEEGVAYSLNPATNTAPLYRFLNLKGGFYLYTADTSERDTIVAMYPTTWRLEGSNYSVSRTTGAPVYRFLNRKNGTYLLSSDPVERNTINTTLGATWKEEGIAFYIAP